LELRSINKTIIINKKFQKQNKNNKEQKQQKETNNKRAVNRPFAV